MKIGDVIHLIGQLEDETKYNYRCKILDMTKNALYIDYPVDIGTSRTVFMPVGESFHVRLIKETAVYKFESKVIEYTKRIIPVLKIAVPKKEAFEKIQRRTHLRVKTVV